MDSRRQEKVARLIKQVVSEGIHSLNDPRIEGFISVTRVTTKPDLRNVDVFLSIFGIDEKKQQKVFRAIQHAHPRLQSLLAQKMNSKYCPTMHFKFDETFKKTLETYRLIDQASDELEKKEEEENQED